MFDGKFRVPLDRCVRPLGIALTHTKITPDHLTIVGLLVSIAAAVSIGAGFLRVGLLLVVAAALPDVLDGALAKASNISSQRGSFFDSTIDRIADGFMLGGVAWYLGDTRGGTAAVLPYAVMAVSSLISYQRAKAESLGLQAKGGLMERAERIAVLCIGLLFDDALYWVMWLMLVLVSITAVHRFLKVWRQATVAPLTAARLETRSLRRAARRAEATDRRARMSSQHRDT